MEAFWAWLGYFDVKYQVVFIFFILVLLVRMLFGP
jgi:hypothetical protein